MALGASSDSDGGIAPARDDLIAARAAVAGRDPVPGLSWSWEMDLETLLAELAEPAAWHRPATSGSGSAGPLAARADQR